MDKTVERLLVVERMAYDKTSTTDPLLNRRESTAGGRAGFLLPVSPDKRKKIILCALCASVVKCLWSFFAPLATL